MVFKHSTSHLKIEGRILLPIYQERKIAKLRIERMPTEIEAALLTEVVLTGTSEDVKITQATRTQQKNWWGYRF